MVRIIKMLFRNMPGSMENANANSMAVRTQRIKKIARWLWFAPVGFRLASGYDDREENVMP